MEPRKRIAVVGNAVPASDQSLQIDSCDLVVRFFGAANPDFASTVKTYGGNSGTKTDILCLRNTGPKGRRLVDEAAILKSPFHAVISELWFARDPRGSEVDLSAAIVESNRLGHLSSVKFSAEFYDEMVALLKQKTKRPFSSPCTGFLAIQHMLSDPRFAAWDKLAYGFAFVGWDGHPFEAEKMVVAEQAQQRQDFRLIT